ncbi:MAG TPA: hypothetical protein VGE67_12615 [Haloferula sp.]
MKTSIPTLLAVALVATATAGTTGYTTGESRVRYNNHGRSGFATTPERYTPRYVQRGGGTTVALTMEKPGRPITRVQTIGRAGYRVITLPTYSR